MNWHHRLRAAGIHLISSLAVAAIAASVVLFVWYPWPYRIVSGGENLLFILMSVDVVIGPMLTLAVFNLNKPRKELRRDLAIIVTLQLCALGYGLHAVYLARPVVLALEVDRFRVTSAIEVVETELPQAAAEFRSLSMTGPRLVNTATPREDQRLEAIVMGMNGADLGARPTYWRAWDDEARRQALKVAHPVDDWLAKHPQEGVAVVEAISRTGQPAQNLVYVPMLAHRMDWSVLLNKTSGDPVGFAPINNF
ncbi:hypothetical protein SAMN05216359_10769 [Roseateles sp. YR242]|uniref:TfpX/TfpZ family type IV pilin accessory protein n=1 Tax=Roseateles sp. YR242 TaxID=1855305 RepID=UPI0008B7B749|nr:TfpX/TfpZ family type IV pilin accessory protein [Roseateles sp. YR242]SEL28243.1 hypothetical protein SAMN05216359_10769 [Roseateles sp. YR242]